jgi:hypothetical protein
VTELDLERRLRQLGFELAYPAEPDLVRALRPRLERGRPGWRRPLVVAVALALLAFAIAFAVPPARSAILRFFDLGAVSVERVDTLPAARERPFAAGLGRPLALAEAERRVGFELLLPPLGHSPPTRVYVRGPHLIATVLDVPVDGGRKPVLLVEIAGSDLGIAKKIVQKQTLVAPTTVDGLQGLWIRGPHVIAYAPTPGGFEAPVSRRSGNALVWQRGLLTLRLEGDLTEAQALRLARTIRLLKTS